VRVARVDARPGTRIDPRSPAMLGAGDHVDADIRWQVRVTPAGRVGVHERGALLPILGRGVDLDDQRVGRPAMKDRAGFARKGSVVTALPNGNQFSG
jgi:hypothetical protein